MDLSYFDKQAPVMRELGVSDKALVKIRDYALSLWAANAELNLFSRKMQFNELVDNHIIDCLLPLKYFPNNVKTIADFGSGGGLPSVIFAIQFSELKFILFEKSPKKQSFLNKLKSLCPNIEVRADIPLKLINVDLVTARAFKPIDVILDISRPYYETKGKYFLLKGRKEKINEEISLAQKKFKNLNYQVVELKSPILKVERNLVLL